MSQASTNSWRMLNILSVTMFSDVSCRLVLICSVSISKLSLHQKQRIISNRKCKPNPKLKILLYLAAADDGETPAETPPNPWRSLQRGGKRARPHSTATAANTAAVSTVAAMRRPGGAAAMRWCDGGWGSQRVLCSWRCDAAAMRWCFVLDRCVPGVGIWAGPFWSIQEDDALSRGVIQRIITPWFEAPYVPGAGPASPMWLVNSLSPAPLTRAL
jgi:hypothetical protein